MYLYLFCVPFSLILSLVLKYDCINYKPNESFIIYTYSIKKQKLTISYDISTNITLLNCQHF